MKKEEYSLYWDYNFEGFQSLEYYESNMHEIPNERGVYVILYDKNEVVTFMQESCAGNFRGLHPTVPFEFLKQCWVNDTNILFVSQAGRKMKAMTLRKKINRLILFGKGKNVPHIQGRLIWQINDPFKLKLAWTTFKPNDEIPITYSLIEKFAQRHKKAPFANLQWHRLNKVYEFSDDAPYY